jgi:hypothetical protein
MITQKQIQFGQAYSGKQTFRVLTVSRNTNAFGLSGHVLVARTGEAWEVARSRGAHLTPWDEGTDVEVMLDGLLCPMWHGMGCEIPRQLPRAPIALVKALWKTL